MIWTEYLRFQSFDRSYLVDLPNLNSASDDQFCNHPLLTVYTRLAGTSMLHCNSPKEKKSPPPPPHSWHEIQYDDVISHVTSTKNTSSLTFFNDVTHDATNNQ